MAYHGLYLVWTKGFARKTEVLRVAAAIDRPREWVAVRMMEFWEWAEDQTADGFIPALSVRNLSAMCPDVPAEFWSEFVRVGWLAEHSGGIEVSKFTRWMGKGSKRRLSDAERKRQDRSGPTTASGERPQSVRNPSAQIADENSPTRQDKTLPSSSQKKAPHPSSQKDEGSFPPLLTFPTQGKGPKEWHLVQPHLDSLQAAYPSLDVLGECRKALVWAQANTLKTHRGMPAFLVNWLNIAVKRGGPSPGRAGGAAPPAGKPSVGDRIAERFKGFEEGTP